MPVKNQVQLITYPDSLGGNLQALHTLHARHLAGVFKGASTFCLPSLLPEIVALRR